MSQGVFGGKIGAQITKLNAVKKELPFELANLGQNHFSREFQKSEWEGAAWQKRAKETKKSKGKHLLVATGRLRQAVFHSIRTYNWREIVWGINKEIPYAKVHNEGYDGEVKAYKRRSAVKTKWRSQAQMKAATAKAVAVRSHHMKMPKRQFMGFSPTLIKKVRDKISTRISNCFK